MGMELKPMRPHKGAPRDTNGEVIWGHYNWSGWAYLVDFLNAHDVDTSEFTGWNNGDLICAATCKEVAKTIEKYAGGLSPEDREWLLPHAELWRTCGGYRQY